MITEIIENSKTKLDAALAYAKRGWCVLPVLPNKKQPATKHGVHDATTDAEQIRAWWQRNPNFNVGVACGQRSGLIVFDVDPRNGGEDSWGHWVDENGGPPEGMVQCTAGGGFHYLAEYTPDLRSCKLAEGVDLLSDGRYFIAAPSVVGEREYFWDGDDQSLFAVPQTWVEALTKNTKPDLPSEPIGETIPNGSRNTTLTSLGGLLRHIGLGEPEILAALTEANNRRCSDPLPEAEVRAIARSVCRYEPGRDVVESAILGQQAATAFLAGEAPKRRWLIPGEEFDSQPAPIKWLVKKWIPEQALCMVHGASTNGKTFLVLDWVLRVASGISDWQGHKVNPGYVVILAGEGHSGLKGRITAWKQTHGIKKLSYHISQWGRDLDNGVVLAEALAEIRSVPEPPSIVVVDTLHHHMKGDENSAQDTSAVIKACRQIMAEFNCSVLLVHHTGVSEAAQHRARGSSAWRAALDIEISVEDVKGVRVVTQRKNKDAELCEPKAFEIQPVAVEGWVDDDGKPYRSAVAVPTDVPEKPKRPDKIEEHRRTLANAWWATGAKVIDDRPYVSRHDLFQFLTGQMKLSEQSAKQYCKESAPTKLIGSLIGAGAIERAEHGWAICETDWASQLVLNRSENTELPCAVTSDNKNTQLPARFKRPVTSGNQRRKATKGAKRKGKTHPR